LRNNISSFIKAIINTYAILFFSQNRALGIILLLVSFLNPLAGVCGLCCVLFSLCLTQLLGYSGENLNAGIYSFNSLLLGLAFGTFYQFNAQCVVWLIFACLLLVMLTVILEHKLGRLGLPILSLPFILCFWLLLLSSRSLFNIGLLSKSSFVAGDVCSSPAGLAYLHNYLSSGLPYLICLFFRSISAILFQDNIITGMCIGFGLFIHSRIAFSLLVIGFLMAYGFNAVFLIYPEGISYYHLGANFMMSSVAIGSFFSIPSLRSYLWAIACIPLIFILLNAFTGLLSAYNLPVFSLPFCLINYTLLYFLLLRKNSGVLQLVTLQHYSPERNLYQFINQQTRLNNLRYFRFNLPFMGSWMVSQGYDSDITHKADWGKALDFVITDENKTYKLPGTLPEHFYCFNKPVLACADGVVVNVIDHVEDNPIGAENMQQNWGNTVVVKHLDGLYSKISHLKMHSIKVKSGEGVKQGDLLGLCGNSGRSPEPHLHFQIQATPYIDAKTLAYPFAYYYNQIGNFESFIIPAEGEVIKPVIIDNTIQKAFDFQAGYSATLISSSGKKESIEVFVDELGQSYFYCHTTDSLAYFINDGTQFYFTSFYGAKSSLIYFFYLAAYKITFTGNEDLVIHDVYPVHLVGNKPLRWLQDIVAPFFTYIKLTYTGKYLPQKFGSVIQSAQYQKIFNSEKQLMKAAINIANNSLQEITVAVNGHDNKIQWIKESIY